MGEITEREVEWATVRRMQQMLHTPHRAFEETHTYSLFNSILCWTLQRIRSVPTHPNEPPNRAQRQENARAEDPLFDAVDGLQDHLQQTTVERVFPGMVAGEQIEEPQINTLPNRDAEGNEISCLAFLIALRNATAHGDGRKVKPINQNNRLVGFELPLINPKHFPDWTAVVRLDRAGMCQISDTLVTNFCNALINPEDHEAIEHANGLVETVRQ